MDKAIKERWIKALRSGTYDQSQGFLRKEGGYCCLGVLCEIYKEDHPLASWDDPAEVAGFTFHTGDGDMFDNSRAFPPRGVLKWAELDSDNPVIDRVKDRTCSGMNDGGDSFTDIANLIEVIL